MSGRPACRRRGAVLSAYRAPGEPEGLCAACAAREAPRDDWRVLGPEDLVLAVAGILAGAAAERPGERFHLQAALEQRGILADHVEVHAAVAILRRRYAWEVDAVEGRPGYRLEDWPFRVTHRARG